MTKAEQLRQVTFRSKFLEHAKQLGNVSATCRYFGISRERSTSGRGASRSSGPQV
jgi:hypothetical protein